LDNALIFERVLNLILLILSLTVHEFSHAFSAWKLGDDTAARLGRVTLNPIPHIDPFGTLILPLLGVPFGWAKPVPVEPRNFTRRFSMRTGDMLVSAVGPLSNLALGVLAAVVLGLLFRFAPHWVQRGGGVLELLLGLMTINAALAIFNLLPIPPLDGSHVAEHLVPARFRGAWESFARVAPFVLIAVILFGRNIISGPIGALSDVFRRITIGIAS
jgi:Zn-dependent protease